ncbi:MAG: tagaturonate epimerase family protein [Candidatus Acidiferrales bacterium]
MTSSFSQAQDSEPFLGLERLSFGVGDRFARQAKAQLRACMLAAANGAEITPVWNKSYREHVTVGSEPASVLAAAQAAARALDWKKPFHIDADHITLKNVEGFLPSSDYYTLDVADAIGKPTPSEQVGAFVARHPEIMQRIDLPGQERPLALSPASASRIAEKYLSAVKEAARLYRRIAESRGRETFITEVSMDETDSPQKPDELLVILAALAEEGVPLQAIAPKFTGRFNKGVDYVGSVPQFEAEFRADIAVVAHSVKVYRLPASLKLSVHSGSDKFSIYPAIHRALLDTGAGVHLKTAGTTWLEELTGLAEAGGKGLALAKEIYAGAYEHRDELCAPYAAVIDIDPSKLPTPSEVWLWSSGQYANALRHDQACPEFNASFRQLLHVGYKIAAKMGGRFLDMLEACESEISRNVTANLYERHLKPLFLTGQIATNL